MIIVLLTVQFYPVYKSRTRTLNYVTKTYMKYVWDTKCDCTLIVCLSSNGYPTTHQSYKVKRHICKGNFLTKASFFQPKCRTFLIVLSHIDFVDLKL